MDDELIQVKKVTKRFGKNQVLDSISFDIPENKITGIVGASGEGKTTILKLLIGFHKPTNGEITFLRRNIFKDMKNIEQIFGFATEDGSFYEKLTVKENIFHFGRLYGVRRADIKSRMNALIKLVGLEEAENTLAENLSIGMKKRLDIACSLIHKPSILIMDEPTADLDPLRRNQMLDLIKKINKKGTTIVLTTQLLEEMDRICDKVAILYNQKIVEEGDPQKIKKRYNENDLNGVFNKIFSVRITKEKPQKNSKFKGIKDKIEQIREKERVESYNKKLQKQYEKNFKTPIEEGEEKTESNPDEKKGEIRPWEN